MMNQPTDKPPTPDWATIPEPVFDGNPGLVELYSAAWTLARGHVTERKGAPASPYMDEAFDPDTIRIRDSCFMAQFCKYSPKQFPGIQSFDNFYLPLHTRKRSPLTIRHPDHPPLFAWIEDEYLKFTGDLSRIERVVKKKKYLQRHDSFLERAERGATVRGGRCPLAAQRFEAGYTWNGISSGMDNTPRGRGDHEGILWFDLLAQQALAARRIARLAERVGEEEVATAYRLKREGLAELANRLYWDEEDGFYYDIRVEPPHEKVKVKTPAAYWALLAGFCDKEKAARLAKHANDKRGFGGKIPWPSVSRDDPDFRENGECWRGGVWVPMAYMATVGLRETGHGGVGDKLAERVVEHMYRTWKEFSPHTIWEAYHPNLPAPAKDKPEFAGRDVRPDFCGLSALGPISLFIESVIGIHTVDALKREVHWRVRRRRRHGLRRLRFGDSCAELISEDGKVEVKSDQPFRLFLNGKPHQVNPGVNHFKVKLG